MTRKAYWIIALLVFLFLGAAVASIGGYFFYTQFRGRNAFLRAEQAYAEGRWQEAKMNYTWYLARQNNDPAVLPKYIDSCTKILSNRYANLRDAGRAYLQLFLSNRSDMDLAREVAGFYQQYRLWRELDYLADIVLRDRPEDTYFLLKKALSHDELGRTQQAITAYQQLIERGEAPPRIYGNLALLLRQQRLEAQGWQVLENALAASPDTPEFRVERARFRLAENQFEEAATEIEAALSAGMDSGAAYLAAAKVYTAQRDWEQARSFAKKAIEKDPMEAEGYFLVVNSLLAERDIDNAIAFLTELDPFTFADNPQLFLLLAEIQIDNGLLEESDKTVEAYRRAYPNDGNIFEYIAARRLLREGRAEEAAERFEVLVKQAPDLRIARYYLALAYLDMNMRDQARNILEMYIASNPGDDRARAVWNAVFSVQSSQDIETAARSLLDVDTPYFGSLISAAYSLIRGEMAGADKNERYALAVQLLERAIERAPATIDGYRALALILLDQGEFDKAHQVLNRAKAANIDAGEINLLEAGFALAEGRPEQAEAYFEDELAQGKMTAQRTIQWAEVYTERGKLDDGLILLDRVRTQTPDLESQQTMDYAKVALSLRTGEVDKALGLVDEMSTQYAAVPEMLSRLNDVRIAVVRMLLAPGERRDTAAAEELIAAAEAFEPNRTELKIIRARLLLEQDPPDLDLADALCAEARRAGATDAECMLISSEIASRRGQYASALDFATKANAVVVDDPIITLALARAQLQMEQITDAILTLEELRTRQPENRAALDLLARAYAWVGRFNEAEALVRQIEALDDGQMAAPLRAWLLVARGDWANAEQLLRSLHEANPEDLWTIHFLTAAMVRQNQWDRAIEFLDECIAQRSDIPDLWVELGNTYLMNATIANLSKASFAFTQALVQRDNYLPALRGLLEVQVRSNNIGGALGLCNRFLEKNPDDPNILERKAALLAQIPDRQQDALAAIERAISISQRPDFYYLRGFLRITLANYSQALEDFQRVAQTSGTTPANMDLLMAEAYLGLNDAVLAKFYFDSAKGKAEREPIDQARLSRIQERLEMEQST